MIDASPDGTAVGTGGNTYEPFEPQFYPTDPTPLANLYPLLAPFEPERIIQIAVSETDRTALLIALTNKGRIFKRAFGGILGWSEWYHMSLPDLSPEEEP
jgi:hypothetical protein